MDNQLKAIIIDDELECIDFLANELSEYCPDVEIVASSSSGKDGIKAIIKHQPDMVFLDIDMPFVNGFDVIEMVPNIDFPVIFTTAYDQYALKAFKISAIDYLLKPVQPADLEQAVDKVRRIKRQGNSQRQIEFLIEQLKDIENNSVRKIALPTFDGLEFIKLDEILYCQSDGAYSNVFFKTGKKMYISKPLRFLEDILCDYHFFRVHNSYIVNLNHVHKYSKTDGGILIMDNGDHVRVSRSKKQELLKLF